MAELIVFFLLLGFCGVGAWLVDRDEKPEEDLTRRRTGR